MLPNVEIRLFECLIALVEEGSVTKAAHRMELSQPRMSNALRRLREICEDPILVRVGQHMVPTDRALRIVERVRGGLEEIELGLSPEEAFCPEKSGRVFSLMLSDYVATLLLPQVYRHVSKVAPRIQLRISQLVTNQTQTVLEDQSCDLAFGFFSGLQGNLRVSTLLRDVPVCIASTSHPTLSDTITLEQFVETPHVMLADSPGAGSTLEQLCDTELKRQGLERHVAVQAPTPYGLARVASSTDYIGSLPHKLAEEYALSLPLQILPTPLELGSFEITMAWHERSHEDSGHIWLRNLFREFGEALKAADA